MADNKVEVQLKGDTKNFVVSFQEAGKVAANVEKKIKGSTKAANSMQKSFQSAANATAILNGPLNGVSGRLSSMSSAFGTLNPAVIAAGVGISGLSAVIGTSIVAFSSYESQMLRLESVIKATGSAAGLTAKDMDSLAKSVGAGTLANADQVRDAIGTLASFKNISGDTFKSTISLAQDLSEVMQQDLQTSVKQLGKALTDPISGLTALKKAGVDFSDAQKEVITGMVEMGDTAGAQKLILAELATQVGGAGEGAAGGLAGKVDSLGESWLNFKEVLGGSAAIQGTASASVDLLTKAIEGLNNALSGPTEEDYLQKIFDAEIKVADLNFADSQGGISPAEDVQRKKLEDKIKRWRKYYQELRQLSIADSIAQEEAYNKGLDVQEEIRTKQLKAANDARVKDTRALEQSLTNKALLAEQLALKVSGNLEAAEGVRYARELEKSKRDLAIEEDRGNVTENVRELFRRREEALYTQHIANVNAIADKREDDETTIQNKLDRIKETKKNAREKDERQKDREAAANLKAKEKLYAASATAIGESFGMIARFAEEGSRAQKLALYAYQSTQLAKATISLYSAIASASAESGPYDRAINIATATTQGLAAIAGIASVGIAHGGASFIPEESTYLLNRGERVLSPNQNRDITEFIKSGGNAMTVNINEDAERAGTVQRDGNEVTVFVAAAMAKLESDLNSGRGVAPAINRMTGTRRRAG